MIPEIVQILTPIFIFLGVVVAGYVLRKILFYSLTNWGKKTASPLADIVISSIIKGPFILWCLMLASYFAFEFSNLS